MSSPIALGVLCICGKPGSKQCGRCKVQGYCSKECQLTDFPTHKKICRMLGIAYKAVGPTMYQYLVASHHLVKLPAVYTANPWTRPRSSSTQLLPLEHFVPLFLLPFIIHMQSVLIHTYSPIHAAVNINKTMCIFSVRETVQLPQVDPFSFATFHAFYPFTTTPQADGDASDPLSPPPIVPSTPEDLKAAFLMLSLLGTSTHLTCCFGLIVLRTLQSHCMTYQGERIIGWMIQKGTILTSQTHTLSVIEVPNHDALIHAVNTATEGEVLSNDYDESIKIGTLTRNNPSHIWLTFVTETGCMYDLDLSTWQFDPHTSVPFVVPIEPKENKIFCLKQRCIRGNVLSTTISDMECVIHRLMEEEPYDVLATDARGNSVEGQEVDEVAAELGWMSVMNSVADRALCSDALDKGLPKFMNDKEYFWNVLSSLRDRDKNNNL